MKLLQKEIQTFITFDRTTEDFGGNVSIQISFLLDQEILTTASPSSIRFPSCILDRSFSTEAKASVGNLLLDCYDVWTCKLIPTFQRNILSPY